MQFQVSSNFLKFVAECLPDENLYFIVSPKDVVVAKLRDQDDHISWLMEHGRYEVDFFFVSLKTW